ncbi:timeless-domain-containing protein [Polyporus arcularius HHB13444]|uniref:Timeless-domain-containing protein n=1 Tax=Polyporus arcularius HHB13444 TaxID=1314778 RepID=A0A5C3NVC1_9APHY|nr:timeless-domain-containing protein [Polyporus arcularius HHB13444]
MNTEDDISLSEAEESGDEPYIDRRAILEPPIRSVVDALGGYEGGVYNLGDECYGCLKDLKKYWRKDDTDDDRTVARIFWETRVLPNDLIPILLETAGKGLVEDKRAVACADLMTAMTWPIDLAAELKELDEEFDKGTDYTQLLLSHLYYKAALLRPGVLQALFGITLPCLAREGKERTERDVQIVNVVLHLVRNLAFIKDLPQNTHASADQAELSSLQSKLVKGLSESHFIELLLTIASNAASDPLFNQWNALVLEIFYLLFRGIKPVSLASDQAKQSSKNLATLLAAENQRKREFARKANTRHSRFGTTISVTLNSKKPKASEGDDNNAAEPEAGPSRSYVLHRQTALTKDAGSALDMARAKKHRAPKKSKVDELGRNDNFSLDARVILQNLARSFIEDCFNSLLSSLLKDIKAERAKITEKDNLRLLYVTKWFLEFFLCERERQSEDAKWKFGLIAEVTDRAWIVWVLRRMREAQDEKPKAWTELQAGIECLTQFILTVDVMASSTPKASDDPFALKDAEKTDEDDVADAARLLQQQIVYNGEVLDISFESMRTYKEGTQSLAYLDASVYLSYALLRMLERWSKRGGGDNMYVRKKAKPKKKGRNIPEGEGVPDVEDEEPPQKTEDEVINEQIFTFDQFEQRFAHPDVTRTLLAYLARYKDFTFPEQMKRVVSLMHRQAVRQKAEGLYFMVSTLYLFKKIMAEEKTLPREQPYKDLVALINFLLRKFFKAVEEDSFLIVEAFFPKNRGHWKQFSSLQLDAIGPRPETHMIDNRFPQDVSVKKGYTPSEQIGIAMAALVENGQMELIDWTKQILTLCIAHRKRTIEDVDGSSSKTIDLSTMDSSDDEDMDAMLGRRGPSAEALARINDYLIPYVSDEEAEAANKNPHLKLLFRLVNFKIMDEDADELEWYIPSVVLPTELQSSLNIINQYLETPIDLEGKKAADMLTKKKRRRRRRRDPTPDPDDDTQLRKKKEKRIKEKQQYKSAEFIVDSDAEMGDMEEFLAKERALRQRASALAAATGQVSTMRARGTKKRRRKGKDEKGGKKRRKRGIDGNDASDAESDPDREKGKEKSGSDSDGSELDALGSPKRAASEVTPDTSPPADGANEDLPKPKPRPRPRPKARVSNASSPDVAGSPSPGPASPAPASRLRSPSHGVLSDDEPLPSSEARAGKRKTARLVFSDDED